MDEKISMEYLMKTIDMKINRQVQKDYDNLLVKIHQQRDDGPEKTGGTAI
jgi:hypothetical protein